MLIALLPNRFPTARSWAPMRTAAIEEISSGSEVTTAKRPVPTVVSAIPPPRAR